MSILRMVFGYVCILNENDSFKSCLSVSKVVVDISGENKSKVLRTSSAFGLITSDFNMFASVLWY